MQRYVQLAFASHLVDGTSHVAYPSQMMLSPRLFLALALAAIGILLAAPIFVKQADIAVTVQSHGIAIEPAGWPEIFSSEQALLEVTSLAKARDVLAAAKLVLYHYTYVIQNARKPVPPKWREYFANAPLGHCETGSLVFADILGPNYAARNFNLVTFQPRVGQPGLELEAGFTGHTASVVELERGAVLVDAMFGIMLVTTAKTFTEEIFHNRQYKAYSLFSLDDTVENRSAFLENTHIYERMTMPNVSAAYSGERLTIHAATVNVPAFASTRVGSVDGSDLDITGLAGEWANHVGFYYEPTTHEWTVSGGIPGLYELEFDLIDGDGPVLGSDLNVDVSILGGVLVSKQIESRRLIVRFLSLGEAVVQTSSVDYSGRKIDMITARQYTPLG